MIQKKKNILIVVGILLIVIFGVVFICIRKYFLYDFVMNHRNEWDIFLGQNTMMSGEFMGFIYEEDYTIDGLSDEQLSSLIVDYYISSDNTFYSDVNMNGTFLYQKKVSKEEVERVVDNIFGPSFNRNIMNVSYGCGRSLTLYGDYYLITSYDLDYCGIFSNEDEYYLSHISDYYRDGKFIVIEQQVGYIDMDLVSEEDEEVIYRTYLDKGRNVLLSDNYDVECVFENSDDSLCYDSFKRYQIYLEKGKDGKYRFYKISLLG